MTRVEYGPKLVHLANQIGKFFAHQPKPEAVANIADHLRKFWDPRMRAQMLEYLEQGGGGLDELPKLAMEQIADEAVKK